MSPRNDTPMAVDGLGFATYRALGGASPNLVVSPVSIALAVAMTWSGARGETAEEMASALGLPSSREASLAALGSLVEHLGAKGAVELAIANRIFCAARGSLVPDFRATCERVFRAGCEDIDFRADPEAARLHINGFIARATADRIRDLLPSGAIDEMTSMVLANAVYLNAKWAEPFEKTSTRPGPFQTRGGVVHVPKMTGSKYTASFSLKPGVRVLELAYLGGKQSLLILVPDDQDAFEKLERNLSRERIADYAVGLEMGEVIVDMPKVDVSAAPSLPITDALASAGIQRAFDPKRADLTGIADPPNIEEKLYVAKAFHAASIRIDEEGTEAAAASAMVVAVFGAPPPSTPPRFDVDRPFLYVLRDHASGAALFVGRVTDPRSAS